jgi:hypothetical protein
MITPGSVQDWVMGAGIVAAFATFAAAAYRWMPSDTESVEATVPLPELRNFPVSGMSDRELVASSRSNAG